MESGQAPDLGLFRRLRPYSVLNQHRNRTFQNPLKSLSPVSDQEHKSLQITPQNKKKNLKNPEYHSYQSRLWYERAREIKRWLDLALALLGLEYNFSTRKSYSSLVVLFGWGGVTVLFSVSVYESSPSLKSIEIYYLII